MEEQEDWKEDHSRHQLEDWLEEQQIVGHLHDNTNHTDKPGT